MNPGIYIDEIGNRYGRLLVVAKTREKTSNKVAWECLCDCGETTIVRTTNLRSGATISCGCSKKLPVGMSSMHRLLRTYKRNAKLYNRAWELSEEEFLKLTQEPCHYCGTLAFSEIKLKYGMNGGYAYNGIDRVDNSVGYIPSNVVTCCKRCNGAKSDMSYDDFVAWIIAVNKHLILKEDN